MKKSSYFNLINSWAETYGLDPRPEFSFRSITCAKCGLLKQNMERHHKACDFMFARIRPDIYASRYLQFHPDDVDTLCRGCHKRYHSWIRPTSNRVLGEILERADRATLTPEWLESRRKMLRSEYNAWLELPKRAKSTSKSRKKRAT